MSNSKIITIYVRMSRIIRRKKILSPNNQLRSFTCLAIFAIIKGETPATFIMKEEQTMRTLLVLGVIIAFLTAIFTAGYEDKPGVRQ